MKNDYKKEEQFLRILANAYISHNADELLSWLPDDFGYDSMWVLDSIKTKEQYKKYIVKKLETQKELLHNEDFAITRTADDGKPVLLIMGAKTPEGRQGAFVATSDTRGNIKRLDLTAADFYNLEPVQEENIIKRTYKTLLDTCSNCGVTFKEFDGTMHDYKGIIVHGRGIDAAWGMAYLDDIPDDFCIVYDYGNSHASMFTKDTKIAVDFVFLGGGGQILKVHSNAEPLSTEIIDCDDVRYVVELKAGQCSKNKIVPLSFAEINNVMNTPHPIKCKNVVYEDDDMIVTKIWESPKRAIFNDPKDKNKLYFHNWDAKTYMDLNGNIERCVYDGDPIQQGVTLLWKNNKWIRGEREDRGLAVAKIPGVIDTQYAGFDLYKINTQRIETAYIWRHRAGVYGYADRNGKIIVKPQYIWASNFNDAGHAIVCKGEWYVDPKWDTKRKKGVAWSDVMLYGMIDTSGKEIVPCIFDDIHNIELKDGKEDNKYFAHLGGWRYGKWGIIDTEGKWIVEPRFVGYGYQARGNVVDVRGDESTVWFFDIKKQKYLFDRSYRRACFDGKAGLIKVTEYDEKLGYDVEKIIDYKGEEQFPSKYSRIGDEKNGHRLVWIKDKDSDERKYGFIDSQGKEIVPCVYDEIEYESDAAPKDMFAFKKGDKCGIADFNNRVVLKPNYEKLRLWEEMGIALITENDEEHAGIITIKGKTVLPVKYNRVFQEGKDKLMAQTDNKTEMFKIKLKK